MKYDKARLAKLRKFAKNQAADCWDIMKWAQDYDTKEEADIWRARWACWHDMLTLIEGDD